MKTASKCPFDMKEMYEKYSKVFCSAFGIEKMPDIFFEYKMMKAFGKAFYYNGKPQKIIMSAFWNVSKEEFIETFLHEMVHIYLYSKGELKHGHGRLFKSTARTIESKVYEMFGENYPNVHKTTKKCENVAITENGKKPCFVIPHKTMKDYFCFIKPADFRKLKNAAKKANSIGLLEILNRGKRFSTNRYKLGKFFNPKKHETLVYKKIFDLHAKELHEKIEKLKNCTFA